MSMGEYLEQQQQYLWNLQNIFWTQDQRLQANGRAMFIKAGMSSCSLCVDGLPKRQEH